MQVVLLKLEPANPGAVQALADAANRTFIVIVFFVLSISLNILTLLRQVSAPALRLFGYCVHWQCEISHYAVCVVCLTLSLAAE